MNQTILLTGATDGIGLETAKMLAKEGHTLLLHGRNSAKLEAAKQAVKAVNPEVNITLLQADFTDFSQVKSMADQVDTLDVLINNAGVFVVNPQDTLAEGMDVRFAVNTVAPYLLTKKLLPKMNGKGRVINLSSAAQMPVDFTALEQGRVLDHSEAYAQSKLAIILWGQALAKAQSAAVIAVNPKSFLGSKMVKTAYGRQGYDLKIGADILVRAALSPEFENKSGAYYDNDYGLFAKAHPAAYDEANQARLLQFMDQL